MRTRKKKITGTLSNIDRKTDRAIDKIERKGFEVLGECDYGERKGSCIGTTVGLFVFFAGIGSSETIHSAAWIFIIGGLILIYGSRKRAWVILEYTKIPVHSRPFAVQNNSAKTNPSPHRRSASAPLHDNPQSAPSSSSYRHRDANEPREEFHTNEPETKLRRTQLLIDYTDDFGVSSTREIRTTGYYPQAKLLKAYCLLRSENRTFRIDRITSAIDTKTGKEIHNLITHLKALERK